ncbi:MAG: hypothetical protein ACLUD2_15265 [Clostridium sp.]
MKLAGLEGEDISETITTLEGISEKYSVNFVLSISMDAAEMPENAQKDVSGFSVIHSMNFCNYFYSRGGRFSPAVCVTVNACSFSNT